MPWDVESGGTQTMTGFPAAPHLQEALASQAINVREVNMGQMCTKAQQEEQRCVGSKSLSPANNNLVDLYWPYLAPSLHAFVYLWQEANNRTTWGPGRDIYSHVHGSNDQRRAKDVEGPSRPAHDIQS
ncbi:hypothetical protein U9M48_019991 [Paspalum notatum var. saurae]|uniref:Uncharacterized protein n=1 Tax=Paspalum notatum var. saurae TaxID=547442 RepID=A0AAQ3TCF0_PASNO